MEKYIGIPFESHGRSFDGADCWGACVLYYKHEFGIDLPLLSNRYESTGQGAVIEGIVQSEKSNWTEIDQPQKGDVIVFRIAGKQTHVGVCIDSQKFIHAYKGTDSCMERLDSLRWKNRISGIYRYA